MAFARFAGLFIGIIVPLTLRCAGIARHFISRMSSTLCMLCFVVLSVGAYRCLVCISRALSFLIYFFATLMTLALTLLCVLSRT